MLMDGTDGMLHIPSARPQAIAIEIEPGKRTVAARWDTDIYCSKDQEFEYGKCYALHGGFVDLSSDICP